MLKLALPLVLTLVVPAAPLLAQTVTTQTVEITTPDSAPATERAAPAATSAPVPTTAEPLALDTPPVQTATGETVPAGTPAAAAIDPASDQATANGTPEPADGVATPATPAAPATADGTAPGNSGSTGWTGGTGGSQIGTNPAGAVPGSKTWQPPTARGLDLKG